MKKLLLFALLTPVLCYSQWAGGTDIYNTNAGNVGIGTTTPTRLLDIQGDFVTQYTYPSTAQTSVIENLGNQANIGVGDAMTGEQSFVYVSPQQVELRSEDGSVGTVLRVNNTFFTLTGANYLGTETQQNGYVLTTDASGNATWQAPAGGSGLVSIAGVVAPGDLSNSNHTLTLNFSGLTVDYLVYGDGWLPPAEYVQAGNDLTFANLTLEDNKPYYAILR